MSASRKPKEPVQPSNHFHCVECKLDFDVQKDGFDALKEHLQSKHVQLDADRILGESEIQLVFVRNKPLNEDVKVIE